MAVRYGRAFHGIELNPDNVTEARDRIDADAARRREQLLGLRRQRS